MGNTEQQHKHVSSRRQVLKAGVATLGAGMLGIHGTVIAAAAPGGGIDGTGAGADGAPPPPDAPQARTLAAEPAERTSYNGWSVGTPGSVIGIQNFTVPGTSVVLPIRAGDVANVLTYVAQRFNAEVEPILSGQCWGYSYRVNVNNPSVWSNHASGTAIDLNSAKHPNGAAATFTPAQTAAVRRILQTCGDVVYWGQDYSGVVDGMHFEIDVPPGDPALPQLVWKIRTGGYVPGVTSFVDRAGVRHVLGVTGAGRLTELTSAPGASTWTTADASARGYILGTPAVIYRNGRCEVYAIGGDGSAWTQMRLDGESWSGWRPMGGANLVGGLAAVVDSYGSPHVFCVTNNGQLWHYYGSYEAGWGLQNVTNGGNLRGAPGAIYRNGRYDVFGIGTDAAVWQQTYTEGATSWNPWRRVGGTSVVGGLGAVPDPNGGLRVLGITTAGSIQQFISGAGSYWVSQDISNGGTGVGTPSMLIGDGYYDVYAIGGDRRVWQQTWPNYGSWSNWRPIGENFG